jgi:hypothetical protein
MLVAQHYNMVTQLMYLKRMIMVFLLGYLILLHGVLPRSHSYKEKLMIYPLQIQ